MLPYTTRGTRHLDDHTLPESIYTAFEAQYRTLRDEVDAEWQRCWHNATLRTLPYDDDEAELFWEQLGQAVHDQFSIIFLIS